MVEKIDSYQLSERHVLEIVQGDITAEDVDAIVNAANEHLAHGGGVAAAIVRRGGEVIQQESSQWVRQYGPVSHDRPAITGAGRLPCRYVIHAVGPRWGEGDEDNKLKDAMRGSLEIADQKQLESIAFPAISTGIFGFPVRRAAGIIFQSIFDYIQQHPDSHVIVIHITLYDRPTLDVFLQVFLEWKKSVGSS